MAAGAAVLAVDGGNSKASVALVARDGRLLAAVRGPTISHEQVGVAEGLARLRLLAEQAANSAGLAMPGASLAEVGVYCLAGADTPGQVRMLTAALRDPALAGLTTVLNDSRAALRAGSDRSWGVVVICGAGVNCAGVAPDGRTAALRAIGAISGDWGGGRDLGMAALAAAVRARDGRGPRTILEETVPEHFELTRPIAVTEALYAGRLDEERLRELSPVVFAAAGGDDAVARGIVDRLADELARMAVAIIRRLHLSRTDVEVVLAGGIFNAHDRPFLERLAGNVHRVAPRAQVKPMRVDPVLGAALLGLEQLRPQPGAGALRRIREEFATRAI
jgi:N-acetylglucosamine kinase-like BadF-type ATPase